MKVGEHMHNKLHIILMALAFVVLLSGCTLKIRSSSTIQSDDLQNNSHTDHEADLMQKAVKSQKTVYEGNYIDEITYSYEGTTSDSILYYYVLNLSNITETSFDFYIEKYDWNSDAIEHEVLLSTAYFIDDGTVAE